MENKINNIINGVGSLLDITGSEGNRKLKSMIPNRGIKKHTIGIKKHFDNAYSVIGK